MLSVHPQIFFPPHTPTSLWPSILKQSREVYEKETQDLWGMNNKSTSLKQVLSTIPPPSPSTYNHSGFNNNVEIRSVGILKMEAPGATAFQKVMNYDLMVDIEKDVTRTNNKIAFFSSSKNTRVNDTNIISVCVTSQRYFV